MMIYLCCFNPRSSKRLTRTEVGPAESDIKNDLNGAADRVTPRSKFLGCLSLVCNTVSRNENCVVVALPFQLLVRM